MDYLHKYRELCIYTQSSTYMLNTFTKHDQVVLHTWKRVIVNSIASHRLVASVVQVLETLIFCLKKNIVPFPHKPRTNKHVPDGRTYSSYETSVHIICLVFSCVKSLQENVLKSRLNVCRICFGQKSNKMYVPKIAWGVRLR